jgi:4-hydroxybenzoate polyprenyltransferase
MDLARLLRPKSWPVVAGHFAAGYFVAAGLNAPDWPRLAAGAALWAVGLGGGTLAFNSAFDRDTGDVGYMKKPPAPPRFLAPAALGLMLASAVAAFLLSWEFGAALAACVALSVLYSAPPVRLKAVPVADLCVNAAGYGALTPAAGYLLAGGALDARLALVAAGWALLFAGFYPTTQVYQIESDRAAGAHTFSVLVGRRGAYRAALLFSALAALALVAGPALVRVDVSGLGVALLAITLGVWFALLVPAARAEEDVHRDERAMYHLLWAWPAIDAAVVLAWHLGG